MVDSRSQEKTLWSVVDSLRGILPTADSVRLVVSLYGMKVLNDGVEIYEPLGINFDPDLNWYGVRSSKSPAAYLASYLAWLSESSSKFRFLADGGMTHIFQQIGDERLSRIALTLDRLKVDPSRPADLIKTGDVLTQLLTRLATSERYFGEFLTPAELNALKAKLVLPSTKPMPREIYDPVCGVGGNLVQVYKELSDEDRQNVIFYGQDINPGLLYLCTWNLLLHGITRFELSAGDTLFHPGFTEGGKGKELKRFDAILADPPLSMKVREDFGTQDPFQRFRYGEVRGSRADYAFLQHILASLKVNGKAAVVVAPGALFRSGFEQEIRENFVRADVVSASIGLPSNLLSYTGLPINVLLFDVTKDPQGKGSVLFVDASDMTFTVATRGRVSTMGPNALSRIVETVRERKVDPGFSVTAGSAELNNHEYSLLPQVYVTKLLAELPSVEQLGKEIEVLEKNLSQEREKFDRSIQTMLESLSEDAEGR